MDKTSDIIFFVVATVIILLLLAVLVINLLLIGRNRKLKHGNELLKLKGDYQKELAKTQIEVIDSTLNDIGQQLHDDVGQMIAFSIVQLNNLETNDTSLRKEIATIRESVQGSMHSLREISKTLSTDYLKSFGLFESLKRLVDSVQKTSGLIVHTNIDQNIVFNTMSNEVFCFRILQELFTNTLKHAHATEISLMLKKEDSFIHLLYSDNGKGISGISLHELKTEKSLGLTNIFKRVELMKGRIELDSNKTGFNLNIVFENT